MSSRPRYPGVNVECSLDLDCISPQHIILELDYEYRPFFWGIMRGRHELNVPKVVDACEEYLQGVDDESTFFILPWTMEVRKPYIRADGFVEAVKAEIAEMKRQEAE